MQAAAAKKCCKAKERGFGMQNGRQRESQIRVFENENQVGSMPEPNISALVIVVVVVGIVVVVVVGADASPRRTQMPLSFA